MLSNTRFAANTLRAYGFLKFSKKEAFKTWILSLPGFLVASKVVADGTWELPRSERIYGSDLHPDIHEAYVQLETYDKFVERLASVCEPNVEIFRTFGPILRQAYALMGKYWQALRDEKMTLKKRKEKSLELISLLEKEPRSEDFYKDFSACLNVNILLKSMSEYDK
jgi:hypothetical protein